MANDSGMSAIKSQNPLLKGFMLIKQKLRELRLLRRARQWRAEDQERLEFYQQFIKPGDLVFDVGANQGNRTKVFLRLGARVVAIDPQPQCIAFLQSVFRRESNLDIEATALGARPGEANLILSNHSTIATLSEEWIQTVTETGRFKDASWSDRVSVPVTTLDALIEKHGAPSFIKIDVEGFENEVLAGLSRPIESISFEFIPEQLDQALECIARLQSIDEWCYQFSLGESMRFSGEAWSTRDSIIQQLQQVDHNDFGDIYARRAA